MLKNYKWLLIALLVMAIDITTKQLALNHLLPHQAMPVTDFFNLTLAFNKGAAFSFLNSASGWQHYFFISLALVITMVLMRWLYQLKRQEAFQGFAIALILGGAWGNVWDRVVYGYVIDFLDFHINHYHWPIFNIADSAICIGAGLMLLLTFKENNKG